MQTTVTPRLLAWFVGVAGVLDCDVKGTRSAVCQKLVEIESEDEQKFTLVVGGLIASLALFFIVAGVLSDPIQTTSKGAAFF